MKTILLLLLLSVSSLAQTTVVNGGRDHTNAKVFIPPNGATLPTTCTVGQVFFKTDATPGQNWYECTATDTWTPPTGGTGTPGYSANGLISGGGVMWTGGYGFTVSAATYTIQGGYYSSAETALTLAASHATLDRIDIIAVNSSGAAVVIQGTNSATPELPDVDPTSQLQLTFVYVAAASTAPTTIATTDIYHENTEWTSAKSGTPINLASTSNPHSGTKDVEATAATTGNYFQFTAPGAIDLAARNELIFYIRSKATWAATRSITVQWYSTNSLRGTAVSFKNGAFGFDSSSTSAYQQIVIPLSLFQANGLSVNRVRFTVAGTGSTVGFYFDDAVLQGGLNQPTAPSNAMVWKDAWNATTAYSAHDVVKDSGLAYVALIPNTNVTPVDGSTWSIMVTSGGGGGSSYYQTLQAGGTPVTQRAKMNFAAGTGITVTPTDNGSDTSTLTFAATRIDKSTWNLCVAAPCATGSNLTANYIVTAAETLGKCYISAKTAPTGHTLIVDVLNNGTSIFGAGTKLVLAISGTYATQAVIANPSLAEGDILTTDITAIGSTIAGQDLTVVCKATL